MPERPRRTEGTNGPRGKGMQDIAAPRDTRGRNLHDGESETYYSSHNLQPRSHSVSMCEWPILLGLSLEKSLSIPITIPPLAYLSSSCSSRVPAAVIRDGHHGLLLTLFHLPAYTDRFTEQRFHFLLALKIVGVEAARRRRRFLALQISFIMTLNHSLR